MVRPSSSDPNLCKQLEEADRLLVGDETLDADPLAAADLYRRAAAGGYGAAAARAAMLAAVGVGRPANWEEALDLLLQGAELGDRSARRQLALIAGHVGDRFASGDTSSPALWRKVRAAIDIEAVLTPPPIHQICPSPLIGVMQNYAPPAYAAWLIRAAVELLEPSQVYDSATGEVRDDTVRTAFTAAFTVLHRDVVIAVMQERAARATGLAVAQHEPPNVISYLPGQKFDEHFDFLDPASPHFRDELAVLGQRVVTCVTYLNDDFEGAETYFPELKLKFRGNLGDCLLFFNVHPNREPDRRTLHAGLPPTSGRKLILSQWLRERAQPLV